MFHCKIALLPVFRRHLKVVEFILDRHVLVQLLFPSGEYYGLNAGCYTIRPTWGEISSLVYILGVLCKAYKACA